jgi:hypothetical protein
MSDPTAGGIGAAPARGGQSSSIGLVAVRRSTSRALADRATTTGAESDGDAAARRRCFGAEHECRARARRPGCCLLFDLAGRETSPGGTSAL